MSKQRSGRTSRMMTEARRLRDEGRAVYVVFATKRHADMHDTPENEGLSLESIQSLRTLDHRTGRLVGAHPNCVVLVDHYAAESMFPWLWAQISRFDETTETP